MTFQDIRKSRQWLSGEEVRLLVIALLLLAALLVGNIALVRILPGGEWFFLRWSGARAFLAAQAESTAEGVKGARTMPDGPATILIEHTEPYGRDVAQQTQQVAYGRPAFSGEYAYVLNDPFFILLLYVPFTFFQDFALARGVWLLLSEIAVVGTILLAIRLSEWRSPLWFTILLCVLGLFSYFSVNALVTGTPAVLLAFLYLSVLTALRSHSDELAGALLALVAYQWEVGGLLFLFIFFFIVTNRRWNVLGGFGMALFLLLVISFLIYPGWGFPYLLAVISDWNRGMNLAFSQILANWLPNVQFPIGALVAAALGIVLFVEWLGAVRAHFRRVVWTASLSLAVTPLIGFAIFPPNHVALLLPIVLILALAWERWQRRRAWAILFILLLVLLIPFGLYARAVYIYDPLVNDLISVLPPIAAIVGLYWMRWWMVRSPRIWFDRIGDQP